MKIFEGYNKNTNDGGFENYCAALLTKLGYKCDMTPASGDYGIDIIATDILGNKIGIQCKNWENNVGINEITKTRSGVMYYHLNSAIVFTTSDFTPEAIRIAYTDNIKLINFNDLKVLTSKTSNGIQNSLVQLEEKKKELFALKKTLSDKEYELQLKEQEMDHKHFVQLNALKSKEASIKEAIVTLDTKQKQLAKEKSDTEFKNNCKQFDSLKKKKNRSGAFAIIAAHIIAVILVIIGNVPGETIPTFWLTCFSLISCYLVFETIRFIIYNDKCNQINKRLI